MWSLSDAERVHRWAKQLYQLQRNPWWVWGSLVGGVLVATLFGGLSAGLCTGVFLLPRTTQPSWWLLCSVAFGGGRLQASSRPRWRGGVSCRHPLASSFIRHNQSP